MARRGGIAFSREGGVAAPPRGRSGCHVTSRSASAGRPLAVVPAQTAVSRGASTTLPSPGNATGALAMTTARLTGPIGDPAVAPTGQIPPRPYEWTSGTNGYWTNWLMTELNQS